MEFTEVIKEVKKVAFEEVRVDKDGYFESVILTKNLAVIVAKLNEIFGSPVWPPENNLSKETLNIIQGYGGIMTGQTLYFYQLNNHFIFIMLWPWSDGQHVTLKCGQKTKE